MHTAVISYSARRANTYVNVRALLWEKARETRKTGIVNAEGDSLTQK